MERVHVQQTAVVLAKSNPVQMVHGEQNPVVQITIHAAVQAPVDPV